jgi:hypothetical protein
VVSGSDPDSAIVVELSDPRYDPARDRISYAVRKVDDSERLTPRLDSVSLFIDNVNMPPCPPSGAGWPGCAPVAAIQW